MVILKSAEDLRKMREAGRIAAQALLVAEKAIKPGLTTHTLDRILYEFIRSRKATPSFLHLYGFPNSACISVNNEVIHGIPSKSRKLEEGDIVSVDVGAMYKGYHGDNARTFPVGKIPENAAKLLKVTEESLYEAIKVAKVGARLGDVGDAVESYCRSYGYGVVMKYCGHGVGRDLHEDPEVPNCGPKGRGIRLQPGMTIAIEPMINEVGDEVDVLNNGWTVVTESGSLSAHFEHTVAITSNGAVILTNPD
jgi:methionyl aminopeptidase